MSGKLVFKFENLIAHHHGVMEEGLHTSRGIDSYQCTNGFSIHYRSTWGFILNMLAQHGYDLVLWYDNRLNPEIKAYLDGAFGTTRSFFRADKLTHALDLSEYKTSETLLIDTEKPESLCNFHHFDIQTDGKATKTKIEHQLCVLLERCIDRKAITTWIKTFRRSKEYKAMTITMAMAYQNIREQYVGAEDALPFRHVSSKKGLTPRVTSNGYALLDEDTSHCCKCTIS